MLPVRLMRVPKARAADAERGERPRRGGGAGRGRGGGEEPREWWEVNELGTILQGERSGAAVRLADAIEVRVARVDAVRGRVDLLPAG